MLAAGSDGEDGIGCAAGAWSDHTTVSRAESMGLDALGLLANNDSYSLFAGLGQHVLTGPTGTNVNDLIMVELS